VSSQTYHTTDDGERIGPKMRRALMLLDSKPYRSMNQLATSVGPHGSSKFGYRIVRRCLRKGLATIEPDHPKAEPHGRGAVVITDKGQDVVEEVEG
jgi:hypothetical protein